MRNFIFFISCFALSTIHSCEKKPSKEKELYEVLNVVYPRLTEEVPSPETPPVPPGESDSKERINDMSLNKKKSINLQSNRKQIIAIKLVLKDVDTGLSKSLVTDAKNSFGYSINKPKILQIDSLKINKFNSMSNDTLIAFNKDLLEAQTHDYLKFDKLLSFSEIIFSEDFNRAVLIAAVGTSLLASSSHLILLGKFNGKWEIVDTQLLEIS